MKSILLDQNLQALLRSAVEIGERASVVLAALAEAEAERAAPTARSKTTSKSQDLIAFLSSPDMLAARNATEKYLLILGFACAKDPKNFSKVLAVKGRDRLYFAQSDHEIRDSGTSVHPRKIPGSAYFAMTNSPSWQKRRILRDALRILGYDDEAAAKASYAVG